MPDDVMATGLTTGFLSLSGALLALELAAAWLWAAWQEWDR